MTVDVDTITGWVQSDGKDGYTPIARPTSWLNPDGSTTTMSYDAIIDRAILKALAQAGIFPIVGDMPKEDPDAGRIVFDGYCMNGDHVVHDSHVEPNPEPEIEPRPEWYEDVMARIDGVEALFIEHRDRFDDALHTVEQIAVNFQPIAEEFKKVNIADKLDAFDKLIEQIKSSLEV